MATHSRSRHSVSTRSLGEFMGQLPSSKQISVKGISIERIKDGKIVERRISYDLMGIMQQLGLVPTILATTFLQNS